jgi:hypothetical protein
MSFIRENFFKLENQINFITYIGVQKNVFSVSSTHIFFRNKRRPLRLTHFERTKKLTSNDHFQKPICRC